MTSSSDDDATADRTVRRRVLNGLDHLMSQGVLGSILVGLAVSKVIENATALLSLGRVATVAWWSGWALLFAFLFVFWKRIEGQLDRLT